MSDVDWTAISAISTAIGTAVVAWYTWETQKVRILTKNQVNMLSSAVQPYFHLESLKFSSQKDSAILTVYNYGGQARQLKISSDNLKISGVQNYLGTDGHQHWKIETLKGRVPDYFNLTIDFIDQHGAIRNKKLNTQGITRIYNEY